MSAINGIGSKFNAIGLTFSNAVGTSAAAMFGQCIGAKKYDRVLKIMYISLFLSFSIISVLVVSVMLFPEFIFSLFTKDPAVLEMSRYYAPVVMLLFYAGALRAPMNGLINGSGKSKLNFLIAILDGIVGHIGLVALLGFGLNLGLPGLWYGNAAVGFTPFFVGLVFLISGKWKDEKTWADK